MQSWVPLRAVALLTLLSGMGCVPLQGQTLAPLTVSPSKTTILVSSSQTFRAVGKDGRVRHNVRWSIFPAHAATFTQQGDEVTVTGGIGGATLVLTATADGDSAEATIDILAGQQMPTGTILWSVTPLPGCKSVDMKQAVPSADGPDLYDQEQCSDGSYIRALTADGREIWRRKFGGPSGTAPNAAPIASGPYVGFVPSGGFIPNDTGSKASVKPAGPASEHIQSHATSVCDAISVGMTRDAALKVVSEHRAALDTRQRPSDTWMIEEEGFLCTISFDAKTGAVVKKKKTVVTD